mgnify:CR=1 FL=1
MLTFDFYFINIYCNNLCYYHVDVNNKCCLSEVTDMVESILGVFKSISGIFNAIAEFFKSIFGGSTTSEGENPNTSFDDIIGKIDLL